MLKKLFKYDFCDIGKSLWIITLVVVAISALGCVSSAVLWNMDFTTDEMSVMVKTAIILALGAVILAGFLSVMAYGVISIIFITKRYYTNLFTDEGYLTFTLPAKVSAIFNAKVLAGLLWSLISCVVCAVCLIALVIFSTSPVYFEYFTDLVENFKNSIFWSAELSLFEGILSLICYGVAVIVVIVYELLLIYFCITLGSVIAKKGKLPLGIGLYFGANTVCSTIVSFFTFILSVLIVPVYESDSIESISKMYFWEINLQTLVVIVVYSLVAVGAYIFNRYLLKNKLNLQ